MFFDLMFLLVKLLKHACASAIEYYDENIAFYDHIKKYIKILVFFRLRLPNSTLICCAYSD